jgi:hypothetical protein
VQHNKDFYQQLNLRVGLKCIFVISFIIAVRNGVNAHALGDRQLFDDHHLIGLLSKFAVLLNTQLFFG